MKALSRQPWAKLRRPASAMLLPLSVLPLIVAVPMVINNHRSFVRYYESPAFPAPTQPLNAAQEKAFKPLAAFTGAIPVLVYYGISNQGNGFSVSQRGFAAQMQALKLAGFQTVSIAQYDRFQHGETSGLPARPILVTFDGGLLDSFRGADKVLAREGFRATMFVITGAILDGNPLYLSWTELHEMRHSGRWDIQPETYQGHAKITVDAHGDQAPFYAMRRWLRSTGEESFADYQRRVGGDLFAVADQFSAQGIPVHAIAVPFGNYGQQNAGNDPRIVPFTLGLMETQFGTVFVQSPGNNPPYTTATGGGPQERWQANRSTTAWDLYTWLRDHDPAESANGGAAPTSGAASFAGPATHPAAPAHAVRTPDETKSE